jgi:hypothetical protein
MRSSQLEIQPLLAGFTDPGPPLGIGAAIQKSRVIPQLPQTLQHIFKGHGFRSAMVDQLDGR